VLLLFPFVSGGHPKSVNEGKYIKNKYGSVVSEKIGM
jgi:hypothetical protein